MRELEELMSDILADAAKCHKARAIDYWNALREVVAWWEGLPPNLRQDIEGSGREPYAIVKARKALARSPQATER